MQLAIWNGFDKQLTKLCSDLSFSHQVATPFTVVALIDSPELQKLAATTWTLNTSPSSGQSLGISKSEFNNKIRIGYFSADFHDHATAYLMAELFELHDKSRFEICAFSFGPDRQDDMRFRLINAFDHFEDVVLVVLD